jgi:hypothetical protein
MVALLGDGDSESTPRDLYSLTKHIATEAHRSHGEGDYGGTVSLFQA